MDHDNSRDNIGATGVPDWATRVVSRVSASEGRADSLNRNLDGNGLSFGIIQWTQKSGSLHLLLASMHATDAAEFGRVFGPHTAELLETTRRRSLAPVGGAVLWEEPWVARFQAAGRHPTFVAVQWAVAVRGEHFQGALDVARILNIRTERALTLFFDRSVHQGPTAARAAAERIRARLAASGSPTVRYRDLLDNFANTMAARFRRTTRPQTEAFSASAPHIKWKQVGNEWHAVTGPWDLYTTAMGRARKILDDPAVPDAVLPAEG
jgi:hypothetical protein